MSSPCASPQRVPVRFSYGFPSSRPTDIVRRQYRAQAIGAYRTTGFHIPPERVAATRARANFDATTAVESKTTIDMTERTRRHVREIVRMTRRSISIIRTKLSRSSGGPRFRYTVRARLTPSVHLSYTRVPARSRRKRVRRTSGVGRPTSVRGETTCPQGTFPAKRSVTRHAEPR